MNYAIVDETDIITIQITESSNSKVDLWNVFIAV